MVKWTLVLIFISGILFITANGLFPKEILSVRVEDAFSGSSPDGFPSPGEKVSLHITAVLDYNPDDAFIVCYQEIVDIENPHTKFYTTSGDTLHNTAFEPTLFIRENCPTDTTIPFMLVYKKDTVIDTLPFSLHTTAVVDSCYLEKKVNSPGSKVTVRVDTKTSEGRASGYSQMIAEIKDAEGSTIGSVELYDDGEHNDKEKGDGHFANTWWTPSRSNDYEVDISLTDATIEHTTTKREMTGFTTKDFVLSNRYFIIGDPYTSSKINEEVDVLSEVLDSLELEYNTWNIWFRGYPSRGDINFWASRKVIIIWATRLGGTIKHSTEGKTCIIDFLDGGGNLFIATSYLGSYINEYGSDSDVYFYENVLCSRFQSRFAAEDSVKILLLHEPFTSQGTDTFSLNLTPSDSNTYTSFVDVVKPIPPAVPIVSLLACKDSVMTIDTTHYFGVKVHRSNHRIVYLSFSTSEISPFSVRKDFVNEGISWISAEITDTFSYQTVTRIETSFIELANPYPNPFIQESTIPFTLLTPGDVKLIVCDLTGRTVKSLISSTLNTGNYYAVWDGRNEDGDETAAGYYFIRLSIKTQDSKSGDALTAVVSRKLLKLKK
jgi:hypothetical protein